MNSIDTALLRRWSRLNDAEAFDELVRRHADMVFGTCRRILGNDSDAEEVAQECFFTLAQSATRIRKSIPGWLHILATHRSLNRIKSDSRRRERERRFVAEAHSEQLGWSNIEVRVDEAIAALPDRLREVVIAHFLERRTHETIAAECGIPRRTVSHRINKGVEQIRQKLRGEDNCAGLDASSLALGLGAFRSAPENLVASLGRIAVAGRDAMPLYPVAASWGVKGIAIKMILAMCLVIAVGSLVYSGVKHTNAKPRQVLAGLPDSAEVLDTLAKDEQILANIELDTQEEYRVLDPGKLLGPTWPAARTVTTNHVYQGRRFLVRTRRTDERTSSGTRSEIESSAFDGEITRAMLLDGVGKVVQGRAMLTEGMEFGLHVFLFGIQKYNVSLAKFLRDPKASSSPVRWYVTYNGLANTQGKSCHFFSATTYDPQNPSNRASFKDPANLSAKPYELRMDFYLNAAKGSLPVEVKFGRFDLDSNAFTIISRRVGAEWHMIEGYEFPSSWIHTYYGNATVSPTARTFAIEIVKLNPDYPPDFFTVQFAPDSSVQFVDVKGKVVETMKGPLVPVSSADIKGIFNKLQGDPSDNTGGTQGGTASPVPVRP